MSTTAIRKLARMVLNGEPWSWVDADACARQAEAEAEAIEKAAKEYGDFGMSDKSNEVMRSIAKDAP